MLERADCEAAFPSLTSGRRPFCILASDRSASAFEPSQQFRRSSWDDAKFNVGGFRGVQFVATIRMRKCAHYVISRRDWFPFGFLHNIHVTHGRAYGSLHFVSFSSEATRRSNSAILIWVSGSVMISPRPLSEQADHVGCERPEGELFNHSTSS